MYKKFLRTAILACLVSLASPSVNSPSSAMEHELITEREKISTKLKKHDALHPNDNLFGRMDNREWDDDKTCRQCGKQQRAACKSDIKNLLTRDTQLYNRIKKIQEDRIENERKEEERRKNEQVEREKSVKLTKLLEEEAELRVLLLREQLKQAKESNEKKSK